MITYVFFLTPVRIFPPEADGGDGETEAGGGARDVGRERGGAKCIWIH